MWAKALTLVCLAGSCLGLHFEDTASMMEDTASMMEDTASMMDEMNRQEVKSRANLDLAAVRKISEFTNTQATGRQSSSDCEWSIDGYTWDCTSNCTVLPGIIDADHCAESCLAQPWCVGFTWELSDVSGTSCYLFGELVNQHPCSDCSNCTSGMFDPISGVCPLHADVILDVQSASSELECLQQCANYPGCNFYTWGNGSLSNQTCFLLEACEAVETCESKYFQSGAMECFNNNPDQCKKYNVLNDASRNVGTYGSPTHCDRTGYGNQSPDWVGDGWYRMLPPAGTKIPENSPGSSYCGTHATGWLNGVHPSYPGENAAAEVCYHWGGNSCRWNININITNCGDYYVYYLPQYPNACSLRYCSE